MFHLSLVPVHVPDSRLTEEDLVRGSYVNQVILIFEVNRAFSEMTFCNPSLKATLPHGVDKKINV